jgi:hypothetical protein
MPQFFFVLAIFKHPVFDFESCRRFQFSFTDFSLVYRPAFAQIFSRSQPMRESNTYTILNNDYSNKLWSKYEYSASLRDITCEQ